MNRINLFFSLTVFLSIITISCNKSDEFENIQDAGIRGKFLVDKIYDYHNNLLAEYFYDSDNKLIKKAVTDHLIEPNRTIDRKWEDTFEYKNERVSKIKTYNLYIDNSPITGFTQESNTETAFEYDSQGKPKQEGSDFLYENGKLVSTYGYSFGKYFYRDSIVYNNSMNVSKHIYTGPEYTMFEEPISGTYRVTTHYYEYDDKPKPNFGLDYLFVYNPFPYTGGADLERSLSKNNMTRAEGEGYEWIYTYNENGLPATIETKWIGIEISEPMLMRITYKQIR